MMASLAIAMIHIPIFQVKSTKEWKGLKTLCKSATLHSLYARSAFSDQFSYFPCQASTLNNISDTRILSWV
jgi:hypothetical protein